MAEFNAIKMIEDLKERCVGDPEIDRAGSEFAYYFCMLKNSETDPLDDPELQHNTAKHLFDKLDEAYDKYVDLVNAKF